jgi:hypothetical protein
VRRLVLLTVLAVLGCMPKDGQKLGLAQSSVEDSAPQVRYLMREVPPGFPSEAVARVNKAVWDGALEQAVGEILGLATHRSFSLDPRTTSLVAARAGFPGQARFSWTLNRGELPIDLLRAVQSPGDLPVHMALGRRDYDDGTTLWMLAWSVRWAEIDPLPRDIALDESINIRVDLAKGSRCQLYIRPPDGPVQEVSLSNGVARWVDRFHTPGEYRVEVVADQGTVSRVVLLFSVFVDTEPPELRSLRPVPMSIQSPIEAEEWLFEQLNMIRFESGLPSVERFELFDGVAREHSAFMGSYGYAVHMVPGVTQGVPWVANNLAHPRAHHHESVATAFTIEDALFLMQDSPGHLDKLLCEPCTHASIGVALEPVLDRFPRLFVTVDLMEFPQGPPEKIRR